MKTVKQPRALATQEKIVTAAAGLFALKGYHDTKLDEILAAAEVTRGAFFHHFQSKEELAFAVIDGHMEKRRRRLDQIEQRLQTEQGLPQVRDDDPLACVFRRLDAIAEMVRQRGNRKGGCIIGNLCTALADTHDAFRRRLAECFDEMALEFKPHLDAAVRQHCPKRPVDTWELARYIVALLEGSIMLGRTHRDRLMMDRNFNHLKQYIRQSLAKSSAKE
jgi:TetR/AcrR family transcriptional regulator, transcriptional repressor for nem operon